MMYFLNILNKAAFVIAPVFWQVVYMALTFAVGAVIFTAVDRIFDGKIPPRKKLTLWCIMLISLIVPLRFESPVSVMGWAEDIPRTSYRRQYDEAEMEFFYAIQDETIPAEEMEILEKQSHRAYIKSLAFDVVLPLVWAFGVVIGLARYLTGVVKLKVKIKSQCRPRTELEHSFEKAKAFLHCNTKTKLLICPFVNSPSVFGVIHPVILLPEYTNSLSDEEINFILLHETGHIKNGHLQLNGILSLLGCVYWFVPKIFAQIRKDMETANDSFITLRLEKENIADYSKTLVQVLAMSVSRKQTAGLISMAGEKSDMEKRIKLIKNRDFYKKYRFVLGAVCGLLIVAMAMTVFSKSAVTTKTAVFEMEDFYGSKDIYDLEIDYATDFITAVTDSRTGSTSLQSAEIGRSVITVDSLLRTTDYGDPVSYLDGLRKQDSGDIAKVSADGGDIYYFVDSMDLGGMVIGMGNFSFFATENLYITGYISAGDPSQTDFDAIFKAVFKDVRLKLKEKAQAAETDGNQRWNGAEIIRQTDLGPQFTLKIPVLPNEMYYGRRPEDFDMWGDEGNSYDLPMSGTEPLQFIYTKDNPDAPVGYMFYNGFAPYEDEIRQEDYHKTVWSSLRLSSFFIWDPFTAVRRDETGEAGVVEIHYKDRDEIKNHPGAMPSVPELDSLGIMVYSIPKRVYAALAFAPDTITQQQAEEIARNIIIE